MVLYNATVRTEQVKLMLEIEFEPETGLYIGNSPLFHWAARTNLLADPMGLIECLM